MSEWKDSRLIDVLDALIDYRGKTPTKTNFGIPLVTAKIIKDGGLLPYTEFIAESAYDSWMVRGIPQKGDLVMTTEAPLGEVALLKGDKIALAQRTVTLRGKEDILDTTFLKFFLQSEIGQLRLQQRATGSTVLGIKQSELRNVIISYPFFSEQKKIAAILSSLDDKIETNRKINARLEELAQAIFKSWFIDFEPFGGKMPEDWEEDSIYRYVDVIYGAPYKSELFNNDGNGLPLIRIRDLKTNIPQIYTTEILPNTEYINPGNIVVGMDAEFEPYFWFGEKGLLNQRVCKFKSKCEEVGNSFILYLTQPKLRFVQSYKVGTTVSHLGKSDIDKFRFIYPPLEVIENFTKISEPILERRIELSKESSRLAALRDTLLPKLMSGELIPE